MSLSNPFVIGLAWLIYEARRAPVLDEDGYVKREPLTDEAHA